MKLFSQSQWQRGFALLCVTATAGVICARADEFDKKTTLTVNEPIQVTDKVLDPGQYVFKLVNSSSDRHIVQIYDVNQSHLIDTIMAVPTYRVQRSGSVRFTFWETPPGTAKAMRDWIYPGDNYGQEFRYPANPVVLQAAVTTPGPAVTPATNNVVTQGANTAENSSVQQPAAEPVTPPAQAPEEVAQNNPPPPAPAAAPAPAAQPAPPEPAKTDELPQTASPYPLLGLGGLALIGFSSLLRFKRVS